MPPKSKTPPNQPTPPKNMLDWMGVSATPNWRVARPLGGAFSLLVALFFVAALIATGAVLVRTIFISTGPNLGAGALIAAILGAPFLIWGTVIKQTSLTFQKEGHITDRISKAVEQLGAEKTVKKLNDNGQTVETSEPNIEVRIGGLLSLERISQDSLHYDKGRDHVRVMEILCAYVRENSIARDAKDSLRYLYEVEVHGGDYIDGEVIPEQTAQEFMDEYNLNEVSLSEKTSVRAQTQWARNLPKPRTDIQQALDIIGRRNQNDLEKAAGYTLDLRGSNLQAADMAQTADMGQGNWSHARLQAARMEGANLSGARMEGANLRAARMERANLFKARMEGAYLSEARMEGAHLSEARMEGAYLRWAQMDSHTSLTAAQVQTAAVKDVDWRDASWDQEQINAMFGDASVTLPTGITPPHHWPTWELPYFTDSENGFHTQWEKWLSDPATYTPPPPPENRPADHPAD